MASYLRHIPPAPLKVGIPANHGLAGDVQSPKRSLPEAADKPAPATAIIFLEERRSSWKALMSLDGAIWYVCHSCVRVQVERWTWILIISYIIMILSDRL